MATRKGVGEINDLVKLLDEYQLEVPNEFKKVYTFNSAEEAQAYLDAGRKAGRHYDGHNVKEGKYIPNDDGTFTLTHCPAGELMVKCIEKAARMMGSPVFITGEYLTGMNWGDCH